MRTRFQYFFVAAIVEVDGAISQSSYRNLLEFGKHDFKEVVSTSSLELL